MSAPDEIGNAPRDAGPAHPNRPSRWSFQRVTATGLLIGVFGVILGLVLGLTVGQPANQGAVNQANARSNAANQHLAAAALDWYHQSQHDRYVMSVSDTRLPRDLNPNKLIEVDMNTGAVNMAVEDCVSSVYLYASLAQQVPASYGLPRPPIPDNWCSVDFGAKLPYVAEPGSS